MRKLPISETETFNTLNHVVMNPGQILVVWEVDSQNGNEIKIKGAYDWFGSMEKAKIEQKKFPENILFEVGSKFDFSFTGWFTEVEDPQDLKE